MTAIYNEDGSVTVTTVIEAEKVKALEFVYPSFEALINDIENPATEEALKVELTAAEALYMTEHETGAVDGSIFLKKEELRTWFRAHASYENAADKAARIEAEKAAADQAVEDAKAALES